MACLALLLLSCSQSLNEQFVTFNDTAVELYAESPLFYNPTAIDIDKSGNIWVTEAVNYRQWNGRNPGRHHQQGDRVVVLRDTDGDGIADQSVVFAQSKELVAPLGILVLEDRVLVSCSPHLIEYRDTDGDFVADQSKILLTGFGGFNHDHGLHSFIEDGRGGLLWAAGNAGPHIVRGTDGVSIRSGSVYNGGGPSHPGNVAGLISDDGGEYTGGLIGRMNLDGSGLEVLAHNFRNNYEVAVDKYGNMFTADNDDDGNRSCRTVTVVEGGNYGYFSEDGTRFWPADRRPGESTESAHWHQKDPGVIPHGTITGAGGPTGVTMYEHSIFSELDGYLLNADAGRSIVFAHKPKIVGSELVLEQDVLIEAKRDGKRGSWFRPSDVAVGPDGNIYVADWYDPGVGGHAAGDREAYGRILKIAAPPRTTNSLDRIDYSNTMTRVAALRELKVSELSYDSLLPFADDESPFVRATCARQARKLKDTGQRIRLLIRIARTMPDHDRMYLESIGIGASGIEQEFFSTLRILSSFGSRDNFMRIAWRLHPENALESLSWYAIDRDKEFEMRKLALDGIAFMNHEAAAEEMLKISVGGPKDIREYADWWIQQRATNSWAKFDIKSQADDNLDNAELLFKSNKITASDNQLNSISLSNGKRLGKYIWLEVTDYDDGNSCDWAAWIEPHFILEDDSKLSLLDLEMDSGEIQWGSIGKNTNCQGNPISINGNTFENGIGTHAYSLIKFTIPDEAVAFECQIAATDGGAKQPNSPTSIQFNVYIEKERDSEFILSQQQAASAGDREAIDFLLQSQEGCLFLIENTAIDDYLHHQLFNHPDLAVRAFYANAKTETKNFALTQAGSAARGQEIFRGRGNCSTCHSFNNLGASIGPDLTEIASKHDSMSLATAILKPQQAIALGYENWIIKTKDGNQFFGSILSEGEVVLFKDSTGKRHAINRDEIIIREEVMTSLMPSADALGLSQTDIEDLIAFMLEDQSSPKFEHEINLLDQGLASFDFQLPDGVDSNDVWKIENGVLKCSGRPLGYIYTKQHYLNFELEFEWRGSPKFGPGNSGVLLRVQEPHKVWPRSIEAQLMSSNAGDIWNIDKFNMLVDSDRTSGRRTAKQLPSNEKNLGEWNHYRISLIGGDLRLEINGELQNSAKWCERIAGPIALQSEGAVIEFRNLILRH